MSVAYVQSTGINSTAAATNIIKAYTTNNAAGNLLFAEVVWGDATSTMSLTDTLGNTWTQIGTTQRDSTNVQSLALFYAKNCAAGANTVTAALSSGSAGYRWMIIAEYSGLDTTAPLDVSAFNRASATTATDNATSGSATTTVNGDLIIGCAFEDGNGTTTPNAGTGFTSRLNQGTSATLEDKVQTTAGAVAATFTMSASTPSVFAAMVSFKAASGGNVNVAGVVSNLTMAAPAGTVTASRNVTLAGPVSAVTLAAPAGSVQGNVAIPGVAANLALAAPAGTVTLTGNANVAGVVANLTLAAPAGSVSIGTNVNIAGVTAALTLAAPAGSIGLGINLTGPTSGLTMAAPAGSVNTSSAISVNIAGVVADLEIAAPAGHLVFNGTAYWFTPPTFAYNELQGRIEMDHLFARMKYDQIGVAIFKNGGFYTQVVDPDSSLIDSSDISYLGGRTYQVSKAEADSLTAAGYGSYITTSNTVITV